MQSPYVILSLAEELQSATNDYTEVANRFGSDFVDVSAREESRGEVKSLEREKGEMGRGARRKAILQAEDGIVPTLAVIVNVAGRPRAFLDMLRSLARQSFVKDRPRFVEVVLVQDGSDGVLDEPTLDDVRTVMVEFPPAVQLKAFRLASDRESRGRGTARNVGIFLCNKPDVIMFLDDAMILHADFVAEQMLRHMRVGGSPIALLGFKENRKFTTFDDYESKRETMKRYPDFRKDWKWSHELKEDEATIKEGHSGFSYKGEDYKIGSTISYMGITDNFKELTGTSLIGHRALPMFFHTGLTSVTYNSVFTVGGFPKRLEVGFWGFEDSYLGLLLAAAGVKLVPCPSSVAYKVEIDEEEADINKPLHIEMSREAFWKHARASRRNEYNREKLKQQITELLDLGLLQEVQLARARQSSSTPTGVTSINPSDAKSHNLRYSPILSQQNLLQRGAEDFHQLTADSGGSNPDITPQVPVSAPVAARPPVSGLFSTLLPTVGSSEYEREEKFHLFGGRPDNLGFTALQYAVATHSFDRDLVRGLCKRIRAPGARTSSFTIRALPGAGLSLALAQLVRDLSRDADEKLFWVIDNPDDTCKVLSQLSENAANCFYSHLPRVGHAVIILDDVSKAPSQLIRNLIAFRNRCKRLAKEFVGPSVTFIFGSFGNSRTCSEDDTFELELTSDDQERCYEQMTTGREKKILNGIKDGLGAILRAHPQARWYENDAQAFIDFLLEHGRPTLEANRHWLARTDQLDDAQLKIFTKTATAQLIGLPIEEAVVKRLFSPDAGEPLQDVEQVVRKVRGLALIRRDWTGLGLSCARRARSILERTNRFEYRFLCDTLSEFLRESLEHFQADGHGADHTLEFARHIFQRLSKRPLYRFQDDHRIARYLLTVHLDSLVAASHRWNVVKRARWAGTLSRVLEPVDDEDPMDDTSFSEAGDFICRLCEDTLNKVCSEEKPLEPAVALSLYRASRLLSQNTPQHASRVKSFCVRLGYRISTEAFINLLDQELTNDVDPSYRANELVYAYSAFEDTVQGTKNREYCKQMNTWFDKVPSLPT